MWLFALLTPSMLVAAIWALARWALKQDDSQSAVVARLCYEPDSRTQVGRSNGTGNQFEIERIEADAYKRFADGVRRRASPTGSICNRAFLHGAFALFVGLAIASGRQPAQSHEISWPRGASRQMEFGRCAKGPCMKRYSFTTGVPHRHVGSHVCEGKGAAGFAYGRRLQC